MGRRQSGPRTRLAGLRTCRCETRSWVALPGWHGLGVCIGSGTISNVTEASGPRNREELASLLDAMGVRHGTYDLSGMHREDAIVMDRRSDGWVVFYSERGGEASLTTHAEEASACVDVLERLSGDEQVFFDLVVGPSPAAEADAAFDAWLDRRGASRSTLAPADWKFDDVPWVSGPYWRRYFLRITALRRLTAAS